jgi:aminoglycoside 3-N-acetyltransferase I
MSRSFTIHTLTAQDTGLMHGLLTLFGQAFEDVERYSAERPDDAYLKDLLASHGFIALAAISDGRVVGGIAAYELRKFERATSEIYVYDLAVAQDRRREGIGTALLLRLKEIAIARAASVIFVQAEASDLPAVALYSTLGKRMDVAHFDIEAI